MVEEQGSGEEGLRLPGAEPAEATAGGRGCLSRGCLSAVIVLLLILLALGGCVYLKYQELRSLTEEAPVVFKELEDSENRTAGVRKALETFQSQVLEAEAELVLGVEDLNLLLLDHEDPVIAEYAGFQRFRTVDEALFIDLSLPVDWLSRRLQLAKEDLQREGGELPKEFQVAESLFGLLQGRYFNAAVEVGVAQVNERPGFVIKSVQTTAGRMLSGGKAEPGRPGDGAEGLDSGLEAISEQALEILLGDAAGKVKSLEIRRGSILLRGAP